MSRILPSSSSLSAHWSARAIRSSEVGIPLCYVARFKRFESKHDIVVAIGLSMNTFVSFRVIARCRPRENRPKNRENLSRHAARVLLGKNTS